MKPSACLGYAGRIDTGSAHAHSRREKIMYDNSATLSLTGSGITILGQSAGVMVLTVAGVLFLVLAGVLSVTGRHTRDAES